MTPAQIGLARHALGLDGRREVSYRNHFVTGPETADHATWTTMVLSGAARRRNGSELTGGDDLFWLTPQGAQAALLPGERLDPEAFPAPAEGSMAREVSA
jgi:hypothetical protein